MNKVHPNRNQANPENTVKKPTPTPDESKTSAEPLDVGAEEKPTAKNTNQPNTKTNPNAESEKLSKEQETALEELKAILAAKQEQQNQIETLKQDNLKLKDANIELLVEMENLRKRTEREMEKTTNFATESLIKELLPFIDSLEMGAKQKQASPEDLRTGIQMSLDMLTKALEKNKVSFISPAVNSELNPELHEAITIVPNPAIEHNHIVEVMQKGILLNGRVVRSAKVIVANNPKTKSAE